MEGRNPPQVSAAQSSASSNEGQQDALAPYFRLLETAAPLRAIVKAEVGSRPGAEWVSLYRPSEMKLGGQTR